MKNDNLTHTVVALREVLRKLTPQEREAVRLRFIEGLPIAVVARRLKMPRQIVTVLIARVRCQLCE